MVEGSLRITVGARRKTYKHDDYRNY